jgi:hypothetical protein
MTKLRILALLAVVALVLFPAIAVAQNPPPLPCRFHGTVLVNGADAPVGTVIQALIDGNVTKEYTLTAPGTYALIIEEPEVGAYTNKTVSFTVAGSAVTQTGTFESGSNFTVDLTLGEGGGGGTIGGGITKVNVITLPAGANATATYVQATGVLTLGIPQGAAGAAGATGATGATGPAGKSASNVMGIVAIVIAAIALIVAVVVMLRKPQAPKAA